MTAEEFGKTVANDPMENIFPKGTDAQTAVEILANHFLGKENCIVSYPASCDQWDSEVVYEILRKYPSGKI